MNKFQVGELATVLKCKAQEHLTKYFGSDAEIVKCKGADFHSKCIPGHTYYLVKFGDGHITNIAAESLRKKDPPEYDGYKIISWDESIWIPDTVKTKIMGEKTNV